MNNDGQRVAALMMAGAGLLVRDIAIAMRVTDSQVRQWLQDSVTVAGKDERAPGMAAYLDKTKAE